MPRSIAVGGQDTHAPIFLDRWTNYSDSWTRMAERTLAHFKRRRRARPEERARWPLHDLARAALIELKERTGARSRVLDAPGFGKAKIGYYFRQAADSVGLRDVTMHTFATRLKDAGVDPFTVRDLLGHVTLRMTNYYTPRRIVSAVARRRTSDQRGNGKCQNRTQARTSERVKHRQVIAGATGKPDGRAERKSMVIATAMARVLDSNWPHPPRAVTGFTAGSPSISNRRA